MLISTSADFTRWLQMLTPVKAFDGMNKLYWMSYVLCVSFWMTILA